MQLFCNMNLCFGEVLWISLALVNKVMSNASPSSGTLETSLEITITVNWILCFSCLGLDTRLDQYEIHLFVKDYRFAREDYVIGLAVLPLRDLNDQDVCAKWHSLAPRVQLNEVGWTILRILTQRTSDPVAREFVRIKTASRPAEQMIETTRWKSSGPTRSHTQTRMTPPRHAGYDAPKSGDVVTHAFGEKWKSLTLVERTGGDICWFLPVTTRSTPVVHVTFVIIFTSS